MFAYCENCKIIFKAQGSITTGPGVVVEIGGGFTPCTTCGAWSKILTGVYDFSKQGVSRLLIGTQFTIDILEKLKNLAQEAKEKNYTKERFQEEAEKISPAAGFLVKGISKGIMDIVTMLAFLIPTIISIIALKQSDSPNTYNIINNNNPDIAIPSIVKKAKKANTKYTPPKKKRKGRR